MTPEQSNHKPAIPELTIIVPAYNEAGNIVPLYEKLCTTLEPCNIPFEILYVNDGSSDETLSQIKAIANADTRVRFASFSRNFGHEAATSCGLKLASGKAAVLIDADLQDPPEAIIHLYDKWKEGFDVVYGRRILRQNENQFKKLSAFLFYRLLGGFSNISIPKDVGDFRLMDRKVIDHFNQLPERNRFVRGMIAWIGFKQTAVEYQRQGRHHGDTKYSFFKLSLLSIDALVSFSTTPLKWCVIIGAIVTVLSFSLTLIIIIQKLFLDLDIPGYALMASGMFFLGGVQLTFLGVVGVYIGKIYTQVQARPLYIVSETDNNNYTNSTNNEHSKHSH